jgi:hypothetical protein
MRGTIHLFIGNRTTPHEITFMPLRITYKVYKWYMDNIVFGVHDDTFSLHHFPFVVMTKLPLLLFHHSTLKAV